jgi:hypothetical protein
MHRTSQPTLRTLSAALLALAGLAAPAAAIDIDLREVESPQAAIATAFAPQRLATLQAGESVTMLALPVGDRLLDLVLEPFDVWTEDAVFIVDNRPQPKPQITLLRGTVAGEIDSRVVIGIGAHATNGFIETGGKTYSVSSGLRDGAAAQPADVRISDIAEARFDPNIPVCAINEHNIESFAPLGIPAYPEDIDADNDPRGSAPCRVVRVAIDTDFEWLSERFGSNAAAGAEYSLFLVAAISEVYKRDVNAELAVPFMRMFATNTDPYTGSTTPDPLDQLRDHWRAAMQHIDRDLVHLFTGANTGYGGVAYVGAMCNDDYGFGVSSYLNGSFPYPLQQNSSANWDLVVAAHELGHNFGTGHTHSYSPPIDRCGIDCTGSVNGTIMSYCHTCSGGLPNIDLRFHSRVQTQIENYLAFDAPCNLEPAPGAFDDSAQAIAGEATNIFVLANDRGTNCDAVGLASVQSPTPGGASVSVQGWDNPTGDPTGHFARYTAAPGQQGTDTFTYTTTAGTTATVTVDIVEFRDPEFVASSLPGLNAAWYAIPANTAVVPSFDGLTPEAEGVVSDINYASTGGAAVGGPLSENVGATFEGFVVAPADGVYIFELESDDGSLLYIGDDLIVDNNGLHGMQTAGGSIGLKAGPHAIRIEFFEASGGAGLIYRWNGPAVSGVVPASALIIEDVGACVADLAAPFGVLDLADINRFISYFQFGIADADLAPPIGVFDLADILAFIESFNSGCP